MNKRTSILALTVLLSTVIGAAHAQPSGHPDGVRGGTHGFGSQHRPPMVPFDRDPTPCSAQCLEAAGRTHEVCVNQGGSDDACTQLAQTLLVDCLSDTCGLATSRTSCQLLCHASSNQQLFDCMGQEEFPEFCAFHSQLALWDCLEDECNAPFESPSCESTCRYDSAWQMLQCIEAGQPGDACEMQALLSLRACTPQCSTCTEECAAMAHKDTRTDFVLRSTGDVGPTFDPQAHAPIEIHRLDVRRWQANLPSDDLFPGETTNAGHFVRLTVVLKGLVNPPGQVYDEGFNPYRYGPNPIYGFIEFDVDANIDTGGQLPYVPYDPNSSGHPQAHYLGNVARFGGMVADERLHNRIAQHVEDFDDDFESEPWVERSGEEFHLAFRGIDPVASIVHVVGDLDQTFEAGETWRIYGRFFHRAHGYKRLSFMKGGNQGEWKPQSWLEFRHDVEANLTMVSTVLPLTQEGYALIHGLPEDQAQAPDHNVLNHTSIYEALWDLQNSCEIWDRVGGSLRDEEPLITEWCDQEPLDYLDPAQWTVTAMLGSALAQPALDGQPQFVWTDIYPSLVVGDVNGSGFRTPGDWDAIDAFIDAHDMDDGVDDDTVPIEDWPQSFSVFDINYDGRVDDHDVLFTSGDSDRDGDVDAEDLARFQLCMSRNAAHANCAALDLDGNGLIDRMDHQVFIWALAGPTQE